MKKLTLLLIPSLLFLVTAARAVPTPRPGGGLFFDVLPFTEQGRQMVPLRAIFEWVGAKVDYEAGKIAAYEAGSDLPRVELWIGQNEARLSSQPYHLDVPPKTIAGRPFVPLRFVAESFGVWVDVEGRVITLKFPQEKLEAKMAIAPHPQSHLGKMWKVVSSYYGLGTGGEVLGIRVLSDAVDAAAGTGSASVMVKRSDGKVTRVQLAFVLESAGWKISNPAVPEATGCGCPGGEPEAQ